MVLVGVGEREPVIRRQVQKLGIIDKVRFLGNRSDVSELYQAMDVFVLPSLFEGIPVVGIEAQFADLPCFFSDKVPSEVKFNRNSCFIGLNESPEQWANKVLQSRGIKRSRYNKDMKNSYYDINNAHSILENMYFDLYNTISSQIKVI